MLGNPLKSRTPTDRLSPSPHWGEGSVLHLCYWLQSFNQQKTHSQLRHEASRAGKHQPPAPPPPPPPFSHRGIHFNNKPHSFQGHSLAVRERLAILISTSVRLSLCESQMQAESRCLFNESLNREVKWVRLCEATRLPFHFVLWDRVRWLLEAISNTRVDIKLSLFSHQDEQWDAAEIIMAQWKTYKLQGQKYKMVYIITLITKGAGKFTAVGNIQSAKEIQTSLNESSWLVNTKILIIQCVVSMPGLRWPPRRAFVESVFKHTSI